MYYDPYSLQPEDFAFRQRQLLQDMNKAINDEFQAIHYYTELAKLAPSQQWRRTVLAIRQDEIKHFYWFSNAYKQLSAKFPKLSLKTTLPASFKSGVRDSINEERDTVPFYRRLASRITDPQIRDQFLSAANDEQRHSEIFSRINSAL